MVAKFDDRTKRLDMPLPNADNFLQDDVARLIETINDLDGQVATLDAAGKLEQAQVPDMVPQLDASNKLADSVMPVRAVMLDATGKIPVDQLPNEGTTSTMTASSEQQMLALNATVGDICDRLDNGIYYILVDLPASTLGNWRMLPRTAVTSINGETGAVTGYAKLKPIAGAIAMALEGVNGPLRLNADASDPYDAVTLKQLQTIQAVASGGASMSGVMNNFIGAVEWFNGDRINIPPGYVAADGDEYQRDDPKVADLWTAVKAGILKSVTQAEWDAKNSNTRGSFYYNRGSYSLGDNAKTFRVPDLNGSASGDAGSVIANAFLGGSAKPLKDNIGQMRESMAPSIKGYLGNSGAGAFSATSVATSALYQGPSFPNNIAPGGVVAGTYNGINLDASRSDKVYSGNAGEIRPNTAVGIWIIRANGSFQAANTAFNVISSDAKGPASGTTVSGGKLVSAYYADNVLRYRMRTYVQGSYGVSMAGIIAVENQPESANPQGAYFSFGLDGGFRQLTAIPGASTTVAYGQSPIRQPDWWNTSIYGAYAPMIGRGVGGPGGAFRNYVSYGVITQGVGINTHPNAMIAQCYDYDINTGIAPVAYNTIFNAHTYEITFGDNAGTVNYSFTRSPISDIKHKTDVKAISPEIGLKNIERMAYKSFVFNHDKDGQVRRGFIAQEVRAIDPQYVSEYSDHNGNKTLSLDSNVLLLDALAAIQVLSSRIKELEAKLGS
ncbi:tail fiber domain-containing protein [Salmonella enterica]|nr:tail fiber domain-containing protein [Salmonella enterica]